MMHVNLKTLALSALLLGTLSGCLSTPEVSVSSLGKKLPAPALKGASPFEQNVDSVGYARIQGTCDARIGLISLSFDNKTWNQIPSTPDITGTNLAAATVNDNDCSSDGTFDVYITKADLNNIWGIVTGNNNTKVDYLYIKGSTIIGDSETLTVIDSSNSDDGGSNTDSVATKIIIEKTWPSAAAGTGKCGYFTVTTVNSNNKPTPYSQRINFTLSKTLAGSTSTARAYKSWSECENDSAQTADTDQFNVVANGTTTQIIYRFPTSSVGDVLSFQIANPSALTAGSAASVELKDPSGVDRWFSINNYSPKIYKELCYLVEINSHNYANQISGYPGDKVKLTSPNSQVQIYDNAGCTGALASEFTFNSGGTATAYYKYVPAASDTQSFPSFTLKAEHVAGNTKSYATATFNFTADVSNKNTATKLALWGPSEAVTGNCHRYTVVSQNENNAQIPVNSKLSLNSLTTTSGGGFYTDDICSMAANSSNAFIASGESTAYIFYKPLSPGAATLTASATGMTSGSINITGKSVPTQLKVLNSISWKFNECIPLSIGVLDGAGNAMAAPLQIAVNLTYIYSSTTQNIYPNNSCTLGEEITGPFMINANATSTTPVFIKMGASAYSAQIFATKDSGGAFTGSLNADTIYGSFVSP